MLSGHIEEGDGSLTIVRAVSDAVDQWPKSNTGRDKDSREYGYENLRIIPIQGEN
jgi:hypothetical protein